MFQLSVDRMLVAHEGNHEETGHKYDILDDARVSSVGHAPVQRPGDMNSEASLDLSSSLKLLATSLSSV